MTRLNIKNFCLNSYYCRETTTKGGVVILSNKSVKWKQVVEIKINNLGEDKKFEFCAVKFIVNKNMFVLVGIYRSPSTDPFEFIERLNELITNLLSICSNLIIAGDLNINVINNEKDCKALCNMLRSHGMSHLITFPTRISEKSQTCIDNFLTSIPKTKTKVEGVITYLSDHDGQILDFLFDIPHLKSRNKTQCKRCFSKENINFFLQLIKCENWNDVYFSSVEDKYDKFLSIFCIILI
jgi:hypothetical protein